jgi:hypothetical protein
VQYWCKRRLGVWIAIFHKQRICIRCRVEMINCHFIEIQILLIRFITPMYFHCSICIVYTIHANTNKPFDETAVAANSQSHQHNPLDNQRGNVAEMRAVHDLQLHINMLLLAHTQTICTHLFINVFNLCNFLFIS